MNVHEQAARERERYFDSHHPLKYNELNDKYSELAMKQEATV